MMFSVIIFQIDILGGVGDEFFFFLNHYRVIIPLNRAYTKYALINLTLDTLHI